MTLAWLLLLVAWPLIEIAVLIKAGGILGVWLTVAIVIVTGLLGASVIMRNGLESTFKVQDAVNRGEAPLAPLMESAIVAIAGVLLITPGLCADAVGLLLLVPQIRRLAVGGLMRWMLGLSEVEPSQPGERPRGPDGRRPRQPGPVIEGEFERLGERTVDPKHNRGEPH